MPLTVSTGLSKKQGLPDYGSIGASCNIQFELEASLLENDVAAFQQRVRDSYIACAQAVNDELARQHPIPRQTPTPGIAEARANGHATNGKGHGASDKQLGYARQLAVQINGLGVRRLETLANKMFSKPIVELSSLDASGLIDCLKAIKAGEINLDDALNGATV